MKWDINPFSGEYPDYNEEPTLCASSGGSLIGFGTAVFETGGVVHQVDDTDRLIEGVRKFKIEVLFDRIVEAQSALFFQLHDRGPGKQLGNRSCSEQGCFRVHGGFRFQVGAAVPAQKERIGAVGNPNYRAGNMEFLHQSRDRRVEETGKLLRVWFSARLGACRKQGGEQKYSANDSFHFSAFFEPTTNE